MMCPFDKNINVGSECRHTACWMHHAKAKGRCAAHDTNSTHLVTADVARVFEESVPAAEARVNRGREKIAAWLALLGALEGIENPGCPRCGWKTNDAICGRKQCESDRLDIIQLQLTLPLTSVLKMTMARWRYVLVAQRSKHLATTIAV